MNPSTTLVRYRIAPISAEVVRRVRDTLTDEFGNRLAVSRAAAPCRSCLRVTGPEERLILFAHRPFSTSGPYAEVGPVFIHADDCQPYAEPNKFPADFVQRCLTVRGYNTRGTIEAAELSTPGDPEASIARLFADERVRFIHVRNPAWGCFDFQVDRD